MTKSQLLRYAIVSTIAACGGKSQPSTAPTPPIDHTAGSPAVATDNPNAPLPSPSGPSQSTKPTEAPPPDPAKMKADLLAAETAAYEKSKPVFEKYCAVCHLKGGKKAAKKKLDHFEMGMYPFGGEHTASIGNEIRKVLGIDGDKPTMPFDKPGSVTADDLATIKAWTEAWQAAGAAGVHPAEPADKD